MKEIVSVAMLKEFGIQYGQKAWKKNPKMNLFIDKKRKDYHLINLFISKSVLMHSYNTIRDYSLSNKKILFVGTRSQFSKSIAENAKRVGAYYVNHRWLGGLLTNWRTIQKSIDRYSNLESISKNGFVGYTKKEGVFLKKELKKMERSFQGIRHMNKIPDLIVIASVTAEGITIKEASKFRIPIVGIVNTNANPEEIQYPIPGNDVTNKSSAFLITLLADAIAEAKGEEILVAYKQKKEDLKILGLLPEVHSRKSSPDLLNQKGRNSFRRTTQGSQGSQSGEKEDSLKLRVLKEE